MTSITAKVLAVLLALAVGYGAFASWRLARSAEREREALLEASNERARADSSRAVDSASVKAAYGAGMQAAQRLVVQQDPRIDALARALGTVTKSVQGLTTEVKALRTSATSSDSVATDTADVRRARFDVRQAPYTVRADVALPARGMGRLDSLHVALDAARLTVRIECGRAVKRIRSATAVVVGPDWLTTRVEQGQQAADICNPPARGRRRWGVAGVLGYGVVYSDKEWPAGPGGMVGLSYSF